MAEEPLQTKIEQAVREAIASTLGCDIELVGLDTVLTEELHAESIDFLDIIFKLERAFDIQVTRGALERAARGDMTPEEFAPDGIIGEAGLERLRELMPEAAERIVPGLRPGQVLALFSTATFVRIVATALEEKGG